FIDNEDYFQRKQIVTDANGEDFSDNDERSIFFAKGVLETVKKLRWSPDIVHCHGWFTGMVPFYLKTAYKDDPMFENCKVVYSAYDKEFNTNFPENFVSKATTAGVNDSDFANYDPSFVGFSKTIVDHSDAIIKGSQTINSELESYISNTGKDFLPFHDEETYIDAYSEFYDKIIG
ncbi:glycogen/starch synthase, partial [Bacteroidales bacterium]|nr:glycogen/starch synthase [Bacteroidales bacterium]